MKEEALLERIIMDPKIMVGKPVIRGSRLTVQHIIGLLANGMTEGEILSEYEGLTKAVFRASLLFATRTLEDTTFGPTDAGIK